MYTTELCSFDETAAISVNVRDTEFELKKIIDTKLLNTLTKPFEGFGYFQVIGMICLRPCFVQLGEKDGLFAMDKTRIEADRASFNYETLGLKDNFEFKSHPRGHEFEMNSLFDFFLKSLK